MTTVLAPVIRTDADHAVVLARIEALWGSPEATPAGDELSVLIDLAHAFEQRRYHRTATTGRDLLIALMEEHELGQADLPEVGPQPIVSFILAGTRPINARMALALADRFHLTADAFLR